MLVDLNLSRRSKQPQFFMLDHFETRSPNSVTFQSHFHKVAANKCHPHVLLEPETITCANVQQTLVDISPFYTTCSMQEYCAPNAFRGSVKKLQR